ncbi:MAG: 5'-nucleotidase C-terminal domain-containing protein [Bacteroidales bacterium]|nr:5'-nucleotidase C-terminal domain-containing protein [Bacteroidales bacterium]
MRINTLITCLLTLTLSIFLVSCENSGKQDKETDLVIFFINDSHSQINNFSKIKHIVDEAKEKGNVIIASSGDMFSGNPIVDFYEEKGYPVIDLMNRTGFDLAALGNHEFDYGQEVLQNRIDEAEFAIISANTISESPMLEQAAPDVTIAIGNLEISFVGVVETNGMQDGVIPSTHPGKLENLRFVDAGDILGDYSDYKKENDSDLLILLSHLGHNCDQDETCDYTVARNFPFFDAIIGGHSHSVQDTTINGVHIYQAGSYLNYLGKISFRIKNSKIIKEEFELIRLNDYPYMDDELQQVIAEYNNNPAFDEVIGYNDVYLTRNRTVGCFYTDALREYTGTDMSIQNPGGIRADLDTGDISIMDIYKIDPFGNGLLRYEMTVAGLKEFFAGTGSGFYYSGAIIETNQFGNVTISDEQGNIYDGDHVLSVAINDYIPMIHSDYFPDPVEDYQMTTADAIIQYVRNLTGPLHYETCGRYYRYAE